MFFFKHRLKMTSLRIGKHCIVKNIASLRKVNIATPTCGSDPPQLTVDRGSSSFLLHQNHQHQRH